MKVSNRRSSNVLVGLVSAAVLISSSFTLAQAEGRLIDLHTKSVESSASRLGFPVNSDLNEYLVEDGSERLREFLRDEAQSDLSAGGSMKDYLVEDGSERLRNLLRGSEREVTPSVGRVLPRYCGHS